LCFDAAKIIVELLRDVAAELQGLLLILSTGTVRGAIDQNVGKPSMRGRE